MKHLRQQPFIAAIALAFVSTLATAAAGDPLEDEALVNTDTLGFQGDPAVAATPAGQFLAVWTGSGSSGSGVWAKHYNSGAVDRLNTFDNGLQTNPAVAMSKYGYFLAVWESSGQDGSSSGIYGRRYRTVGDPLSDEFRINTLTAGDQRNPAVAVDHYGGRYVVAWSTAETGGGYSVHAQLYDSSAAVGEEFRVNAVTTSAAVEPAVAMADDGQFVVAWAGKTSGSGSYNEILARRYDRDGAPLGAEFRVHGSIASPQGSPTVEIDGAGNFIIAWHGAAESFGTSHIQARRFDASGTALGNEFRVSNDSFWQRWAKVAIDADGDAVIVWESLDQDGSDYGIFGQRYDSQGNPLGGEFAVNKYAPGAQLQSSVAIDADGDFLVAWGSEGQDGDSYGVYGRRYAGAEDVDLMIELSDETDPVQSGGWLVYRAVVSNLHAQASVEGVGSATGIQARMDLPTGTTLDSTAGNGWTCDRIASLTCRYDRPLWAGGQADPLSVYLIGPAGTGQLTATAAVSAHQSDSVSGNNSDSETTRYGDVTPDAFSFNDLSDVARATVQTSNSIIVSGIDAAVPISVAGGSYSVNGQAFTSSDGTVVAGDQVRVRHTSASAWNTAQHSTLSIGDASDTFTTVTESAETVPDAFAFNDVAGVARSTLISSNAVTVSGINAAAPISVSGGSYSIDGGPYTSVAGTVANGSTVHVRHTTSTQFGTRVDTSLNIGGVADTFSSTTLDRDVSPDPFSFPAQNGIARNSAVISAAATIQGINDAAPVSVSGGAYSIDGGAFTTAAGTISNGQSVRVQHTSSSAFQATVSTTLTIGDVGAVFSSTTEAQDTTPNAFAFADVSGAATGSTQTSAAVTVAGINSPATISVSGGQYSINAGAFTSAAGTVNAGDQVRVQHLSASAANSSVNTTLTIGGVSDTFTSTTGSSDTTPNAFSFTDVSGARRNAQVTSNTLTVSGINAAVPISVSGGNAQYSRNGGAYTSSPGTVTNGNTVRVRVTSASTTNTPVNVVVTIGGLSDTWTVTTGSK